MEWCYIVILFIVLNAGVLMCFSNEMHNMATLRHNKTPYNKKIKAACKEELKATKHGRAYKKGDKK